MILICDDDEAICRSLSLALRGAGWETALCGPTDYLTFLSTEVDLVLLDLNLGSVSGLEYLKNTLESRPDLPVLMVSGQATLQDAMEAIRLGARDFLEKPVSTERLTVSVRNALQERGLAKETRSAHYPVAVSPALLQALDRMARAARSEMPILVQGESGSGKDAAAGYIHALSTRAGKPLVRLNCGAIPETLIESELFGHVKGSFTGAVADYPGKLASADGGTLFLDEVGDLPVGAQTRLLRFLENGELQKVGAPKTQICNVRVISASHKDLDKAVAEGSFRADLLYRLRVLPVPLPPLRDRREDILPLVEHFFRLRAKNKCAAELFSAEAIKLLVDYPWPGNVRELRAVCERLLVWSETFPVGRADLAPHLQGNLTAKSAEDDVFSLTLPYAEAKRRLELRYLQTQIRLHGSVKAAAEALGILPNNLSRRLGELSLKAETGE